MKRMTGTTRILLPLLALLVVAGTVLPAAAQDEEAAPEYLVPEPTGWTRVDQEYQYGRDNLWEYINGAAELFLTYRFRQMTVADFEQGEMALSVSVYDMSRPLDAYGVFESEKPAGAAALEGVGAAAVLQAPYQGLLLKDRWYVKVEVGAGDVTSEDLENAMRDIADGLSGTGGLPPQLAALPEAGRVPGSVAFTGGSFLGLGDLNACLHADYEADGLEYRLFVMKPSAEFLRNESGRWHHAGSGDEQVWQRKVPYSGVVVLRGNDEQLVGVSGFEKAGDALGVLKSLDD